MPRPKFDKKGLKKAFVKTTKFKIPWDELKKFDKAAIDNLVASGPAKKRWDKRQRLNALLDLVPELQKYREYLWKEVNIEGKSMVQIAKKLGSKDTSIRRHLDYFDIPPNKAFVKTRPETNMVGEERHYTPTKKDINGVRPSLWMQKKRRRHVQMILEKIQKEKEKKKQKK